MKTAWSEDGWQDYLHWQKEDPKVLEAINTLIKDIKRDPFKGLGKPEPLKHDLAGWWSRRITNEHRLVYRLNGKGETQQIEIIQCRYHY
ncbi:Txe/YoeB family addiction module toxin [Bradyrhizobium cenepequi]|uniref:Txe/YoeB family addiction module toxin n=1 Tax=Bradyrhizobium cenepequi TaxID=2821403 RepID=UPI001CE33ED4|nr:Txe/YoeB family addiction module toxin [Bradyrhizobium cenepequi]MCA6108082.1 Txe/YoeB family addiction module toxin [Bradyrhizobium cenepequi]